MRSKEEINTELKGDDEPSIDDIEEHLSDEDLDSIKPN